jgi:anti-sigma B factor antagonist
MIFSKEASVDLTRDKIGDVDVVALEGEHLDASNTQDFKRDVAALVGPSAKVVLDLGRVTFVDSSGCGAILSVLRQLKSAGGDLKLCAVTKPVRSLFELVRMRRIFDIFDTREEAVKAFQA